MRGEWVAGAGKPGAVSVATLIAGRGTNIHTGDLVVQAGGGRVDVMNGLETRRMSGFRISTISLSWMSSI